MKNTIKEFEETDFVFKPDEIVNEKTLTIVVIVAFAVILGMFALAAIIYNTFM